MELPIEIVPNAQLTPDRPDDPDCTYFTLREGSVWITVENLSVYIVDAGDAVTIEVLPHFEEAHADPLDTGIAYFPAKAVAPEPPLPERVSLNTQLMPDDPEDPYCTDFTLCTWSVWIRVRNLSVNVRREDTFAMVEIFPLGEEETKRPALDTVIAYYDGCSDDDEEDLDNGGAGICQWCGEEFSPDDYGQQFCSEACCDACDGPGEEEEDGNESLRNFYFERRPLCDEEEDA